MDNPGFFSTVISSEDHHILAMGPQLKELTGNDVFMPLENHMCPEDQVRFAGWAEGDARGWFVAHFLKQNEEYLYLIRSTGRDEKSLRLYMGEVSAIMADYTELMRGRNSYRALLHMRDELFFVYDEKRDVLSLENTDHTDMLEKSYTLDRFRKELLQRVKEGEEEKVEAFTEHLRQCAGRYSVQIEGDILVQGNDENMTSRLNCQSVLHRDESETVVGFIKVFQNKGRRRTDRIKYDSLTGLMDKGDITRLAREAASEQNDKGTTIAIIDVDYFKSVNDIYGHQFGDKVLQRIAGILEDEIGAAGTAGRIGGDEFFVVFHRKLQEPELRGYLEAFRNRVGISFPDISLGAHGQLSLSVGTATYPVDADNYDDLFFLADFCLYRAKEKGRDRYIIYTPSKHGSLEEIKNLKRNDRLIGERGEDDPANMIIDMLMLTKGKRKPSAEDMLAEFCELFSFSCALYFEGKEADLVCMCGKEPIRDEQQVAMLQQQLRLQENQDVMMERGFMAVNQSASLPDHMPVKQVMKALDIRSFVLAPFTTEKKTPGVLMLLSLGRLTKWNEQEFKYFRLFTDVLAKCTH